MFNEETIFYLVTSLSLARLTIESLVENRNDLSPLCAVGKTITDLERFEKIADDLLGPELASDYAKTVMNDTGATWRAAKDHYQTIKNGARVPANLLFLSATTNAGLFAVATIEFKISKLNNAAANDVLSYAKLIFENASAEINQAGQAYFAK